METSMKGGEAEMVTVIAVKDSPARNLPDFVERYTERYKIPCTWEANFNYGGMRLLAMAMEEAGTVSDVRAIREAFEKATPIWSSLPRCLG
jgi:ABC-type branched-subunit amino acid transport system substrate-binding protein